MHFDKVTENTNLLINQPKSNYNFNNECKTRGYPEGWCLVKYQGENVQMSHQLGALHPLVYTK